MHKKHKLKLKKTIKKKKPCLTKEYLQSEMEISKILDNSKYISLRTETPVPNNLDFFLNSNNLISDDLSKSSKLSLEDKKESPPSVDELELSPTARSETQPASSYIQIEDIENFVSDFGKIKIYYNDDELYYQPSSKQLDNLKKEEVEEQSLQEDGIYHPDLQLNNKKSVKGKNMIKMVNRFYEEGNCEFIKTSSTLQNMQDFEFDSKLYKTKSYGNNFENIESKKFNPIFCSLKLSEIQEQKFTKKRLLTLTLKELIFSQHPLQIEEHHLANKLENYLKAYGEKSTNNTILKLTSELDSVRGIMKNLIDSDGNDDSTEKLEILMDQTKILRQKLHREELILKNLICNSIDMWFKLKQIRKNQGFNYTNIQLIIKIKEIENLDNDELKWNERYQIELAETLREEYQKYYKNKENKKFRKPDVELIKMDVKEILKNCTRLPGEPKIKLDFKWIEDRCKNLKIFKDYNFRIFFDDEFVGNTKNFKLGSDFKIEINQCFGVYLETKIPNNITIEAYEKSKLSTQKKMITIYLPLQMTIDYSEGLAENIEFSSSMSNDVQKLISGSIRIVIRCDKMSSDALYDFTNSNFKIPHEKLKQWYENKLINPLSPYCSTITNNFDGETIRSVTATNQIVHNTLNFNEDLLPFCSEDEIENNERLNWLKARYEHDMKYKDFKFIPLFENELEEESDIKVLNEGDWMDPINLHKHKGKKHLLKVYDIISNYCRQLNRNDNYRNLLIGDESPTIRSTIESIVRFFGPKRDRPLNSANFVSAQVQHKNLQSYNIVVSAFRATGVPLRNFLQPKINISSGSLNEHSLKLENVRPFVNICFKDKSARTTTAEGSHPTWNEQLVLQINNFDITEKEELKIQIFDEYLEDLVSDENDFIGARSMEVFQRIFTYYLGEYRIPISTLFSQQKIEAVFEVNIPQIIVGYTKPRLDAINKITHNISSRAEVPEMRNSIYIWLFITVEPQFDYIRLKTKCLECAELTEVKVYIYEWLIQLKEIFPERYFDPLISLESGKRVCLTRLLESIVIPFEYDENVENLVRRYVSLISVLKSSGPCLGLNGIWLTNQTILDVTWASPKDLGVLLSCFYLNLGLRCWIILGISYPYGDCTYVLMQEESLFILIDPCTGRKYDSTDVNCPLAFVYCIVGQDNVYYNIQTEQRISMMDFNIQNNSLWLALFNKKNPAPVGGVQKLDYQYKNFNISSHDLRNTIERKIMKKINSWRSTRKTIWNRGFYNVMYDILTELEQDVILGRDSENYLDRINSEFPNYKIYGFTLNFPYTSLSSISNRIRSTLIQLNSDPNVEFSVACYVHQYPNNILSCWIFILNAIPLT